MMINAVLSFVYVAFLCFGSGSRASGRRLPEEYPQNAGTHVVKMSLVCGFYNSLETGGTYAESMVHLGSYKVVMDRGI